jgi:hypothetical protein
MQHTYNYDGTRNRSFRPYIYPEETTYNTSLYDPSRPVNYGLYDHGVQPGAITTAEDIRLYMKNFNTQKTHNYPNIGDNVSDYNPDYIKNVYTYHNSPGGNGGLYKNLYAL